MHKDITAQKKATGSTNYLAGDTNSVILPAAVSTIKFSLIRCSALPAVMFRGDA